MVLRTLLAVTAGMSVGFLTVIHMFDRFGFVAINGSLSKKKKEKGIGITASITIILTPIINGIMAYYLTDKLIGIIYVA